ncbi:CLUMA_CG016542, isoform A [Clunio marinus]|uniref:CLUMA_CG016542, isoform A n=1 Tax=Clunio marinus TaxID=568069 RepID=A0A1J1ITY2_9DIPT|nr:CLUMA_CG016542, isoform A [Clunio marinus]
MKMIVKSSVFLIVITFVSTASSSSQKCEPVPGCTDNGVFYPIGASVPQNNPCKTCFCAENGLKCAEIACAAPPPGCVTQNNPDRCCPEILYCGCEVDGTIYKIGEEIPDNDPCTGCTCEVSGNGAEPVCWAVGCGAYPGACVTQNVPGQCCPEILYCGCEVDGTIYKIGEEIPDNDPCSGCTCENSDNGPEPLCWAIACDAPPPGCVTQNNPDQCCPEILYCGCEVDGTVYKIGDDIPNESPCVTCTCEESDSGGNPSCYSMSCLAPPPGCENVQPPPDVCCPDYQALGCETDSIDQAEFQWHILVLCHYRILPTNTLILDGLHIQHIHKKGMDHPQEYLHQVYRFCHQPHNHNMKFQGNIYQKHFDKRILLVFLDNSSYKTLFHIHHKPVCWAVGCPEYPGNCVTQNVTGQCCPEISYCGCEVDGKIYKIGEQIPDDDPCIFLSSCEPSENGPEPIRWVSDCGDFPPGCVTQTPPGQCCPEILYCGCMSGGKWFISIMNDKNH